MPATKATVTYPTAQAGRVNRRDNTVDNPNQPPRTATLSCRSICRQTCSWKRGGIGLPIRHSRRRCRRKSSGCSELVFICLFGSWIRQSARLAKARPVATSSISMYYRFHASYNTPVGQKACKNLCRHPQTANCHHVSLTGQETAGDGQESARGFRGVRRKHGRNSEYNFR
ncbi:MAG: hypothetical protein JWR69_615 [Pedosphaera sp.]|nr:hypothetical protein [Pedosphaera sp.]